MSDDDDVLLVAVNVILHELGQVDLSLQTWTTVVWTIMQKVERYPLILTGPQKKRLALGVLKTLIDQVINADEKQALLALYVNVSAQIDLMVSIANATEKLGKEVAHSCCPCLGSSA